jgi:type III restriction enzyme
MMPQTCQNIADTYLSTDYGGTRQFYPFMIKDVFTDKTLSFSSDESDDKEFGKSMNDISETSIATYLDLRTREWYAFNDCYGTSEEKLLVKYIDRHADELKLKYSDVYLIRNERHFKIYNFEDGRALEPDFVLYLVGIEEKETMHYQIFIEPKGGHLLRQDEWKEGFLKSLREKSHIEQLWSDRHYCVWGLPFFNSIIRQREFGEAFDGLLRH